MTYRIEKDTMGEVKVPENRYYGAQTQRSIENFPICKGNDGHKMPKEVIYSMLLIKKAAAIVNKELKIANPSDIELAKITPEICTKIIDAVNIIIGVFDDVSPICCGNQKFEDYLKENPIPHFTSEYIKYQKEQISRIRNSNNIPENQGIFDWFYKNEFPLVVWQTGSGTQTNMNINEVIASVANEIETGKKGGKNPVHPNDHVNLGQSSNDTFPTAMNVTTLLMSYEKLLPTLVRFTNELRKKEDEFKDIIKIGRTHTQDATSITLGQEFGGYKCQISSACMNISSAMELVHCIAQGGTAVGTGINCPKGFAEKIGKVLTTISGFDVSYKSLGEMEMARVLFEDGFFKVKDSGIMAHNLNHWKNGFFSHPKKGKFMALATSDELVNFHGALNTLACSIIKIANDIRFLASGPRSGLGEISLPENEPGSSIMPGKVNPTQCEALTMISCQVIGNNVAVTTGGMQGHFELNVFRPMIIRNIVESINLLTDGINSFIDNCLIGIKANEERIKELLDQSLMLVTALNPYIGYDNAAAIAKNAHKKNLTLKESAKELEFLVKDKQNGKICESDWDKIVDPRKLI